MDDKFRNKYRISSTRLQHWDYGWNASYFVTICTKNREHYFGNIVNGEMQLSEIGGIAQSEWLKSPNIRPDMNLELGAFVVMPNHFHGIVIIGKNKYNRRDGGDDYCGRGGGDDYCGRGGRDAMHCVSTDTDTDTDIDMDTNTDIDMDTNTDIDMDTNTDTNTNTKMKNKFGPQSQNLASIIRGYKIGVKKYATMNNIDFAWQSLYNDHIIRDNQSFNRIRKYINNNIKDWKNDYFNK